MLILLCTFSLLYSKSCFLGTANQIEHLGLSVEKKTLFGYCNGESHCRHSAHTGHNLLLGEEKQDENIVNRFRSKYLRRHS